MQEFESVWVGIFSHESIYDHENDVARVLTNIEKKNFEIVHQADNFATDQVKKYTGIESEQRFIENPLIHLLSCRFRRLACALAPRLGVATHGIYLDGEHDSSPGSMTH